MSALTMSMLPSHAPRAALEFRLARWPIRIPYVAGCAAADAFLAGIEEKHALWRRQIVGYSRLHLG